MIERILKIMAYKNLNASQFAEKIGIQRAAISHILNGRNNVSLDVFKKILERYPDINAYWLLFGKGEMRCTNATNGNEKEIFPQVTIEKVIESQKSTLTPEAPPETSVITVPKNVHKIIVFYSDETFETFVSEKGMKE